MSEDQESRAHGQDEENCQDGPHAVARFRLSAILPSVKLILASASPRRAELLRALGLTFEVHAATQGADPEDVVPDAPAPGEDPVRAAEQIARRLADTKADAVALQEPEAVVIGADTIVVLEGRFLGKPRNPDDARGMLRALSSRHHHVVTGVSVVRTSPPLRLADSAVTAVWFRPLRDDEIERYVTSGEPMDKAGAYGIQGQASLFVERIDGDYFTVVGLPLSRLAALLEQAGVRVL